MEMKEKPAEKESDVLHRIELLISWILRGGVIVSMITVLTGLALMFAHHPDYFRSAADLKRLTTPGAALPHSATEVARGVAAGRGEAIVAVGLLLLIATPILRVAISLVGFALERDRLYAAISAAVLVLLTISFLLGKVE